MKWTASQARPRVKRLYAVIVAATRELHLRPDGSPLVHTNPKPLRDYAERECGAGKVVVWPYEARATAWKPGRTKA